MKHRGEICVTVEVNKDTGGARRVFFLYEDADDATGLMAAAHKWLQDTLSDGLTEGT